MIILYSQPNCPHCDDAKTYLTENDIPFEERNIRADYAGLDFLLSKGHKTVPQLYIDTTLFVEGGAAGLRAMSPEQIIERIAVLRDFNANF